MDDFLKEFGWIADIYMIDHVIEKHWDRLPDSWKAFFESLASPKAFVCLFHEGASADLIEGLFNLKKFVESESVSRKPKLSNVTKLGNKLRVKIKQKKEHEITRIIALCEEVMREESIDEIVDLGAGLGHLSRILGHHLAEKHPEKAIRVSTVEGDSQLVESSLDLDARFAKRVSSDVEWIKPSREDAYIESDTQLIQEGDAFKKLLLGLHTCGDFSPTIIRYFANHSSARHLLHFGCCYHKLNGGDDKLYAQVYDVESQKCREIGFPMSARYSDLSLSYAARELACHAQEQFVERIKTESDFSSFTVNCYRAVLEWLLVAKLGSSSARHRQVRSVKKAENFWDYVKKALEGDDDLLEQIEAMSVSDKAEVEALTRTELRRIFAVYCLRLMIAPVIESIILRDRRAFLEERGINADLVAVFDPVISARSIVLRASK